MNKFILLWFGLVITLIYPSCKCCKDPSNPDCKNYDPCYGKENPQSGFWMYETVDLEENLLTAKGGYIQDKDVIDLDTIEKYNWVYQQGMNVDTNANSSWLRAFVVFECKNPNAKKVSWYIGNHVKVLHGKQVSLEFDRPYFGTHKVMMVSEYDKSPCFPNRNGLDTSIRYLTIRLQNDNRKLAWHGKYSGYNTDAPNELFDVQIVYNYTDVKNVKVLTPIRISVFSDTSFLVRFLPKNSNIDALPIKSPMTKTFRNYSSGSVLVAINNSDTISIVDAYGEYNSKLKQIRIQYAWYDLKNGIHNKTFIGLKK